MATPRVIVAMSGGVDSAVTAGLLVRQGYDVIGITMRLWAQDDPQAPRLHRRCCPAEDTDDARAAADALGIPHYVLNMEEEFSANVVDYFIREYARGRTPNPCLPCNEHVKFRALLDISEVASFADYFIIATATNARQMRAVVATLTKELRGDGVRPRHQEGEADSGWVLLDYGSIIVHLFSPELRDRYNLEELWREAKQVVRLQ